VLDAVLRSVAADPSQDRKAVRDRSVDGLKVALLQVREDALPCSREARQVSPHVALVPEGEIHDRGTSTEPGGTRRELSPQRLGRRGEPLGLFPGQLDETVHDHVGGRAREELRAGGPDLGEAEVDESLHRPVDLRGGDLGFAAEGPRICHAEIHKSEKGLSRRPRT
jgi:hypothetical protein